MIQSKYVQDAIKSNLDLIMVKIKRWWLIKIQAQSKKLCFHINHVKAVETEIRSTNA